MVSRRRRVRRLTACYIGARLAYARLLRAYFETRFKELGGKVDASMCALPA